MTDGRVDRGSQIFVPDLRCDRRDAAQGNLLLRPEMRFELESLENVEAPTAEVQRVDLRRILFGIIGEGIEVGAPQATVAHPS